MNALNCFKAYGIRGYLGIDLDEHIAIASVLPLQWHLTQERSF